MRIDLGIKYSEVPIFETRESYNRVTIYNNSNNEKFDVIQNRLYTTEFINSELFIRATYFYKKVDNDNLYLMGSVQSAIEIDGDSYLDHGMKIVNNYNAYEYTNDSLSEVKYYSDKFGFFKKYKITPDKTSPSLNMLSDMRNVFSIRDIITSDTEVYNCELESDLSNINPILKDLLRKLVLDSYLYGIQKLLFISNSMSNFNVKSLFLPSKTPKMLKKLIIKNIVLGLKEFVEGTTGELKKILPIHNLYIYMDNDKIMIKIHNPLDNNTKTVILDRGTVDFYIFGLSKSNVLMESYYGSSILLLE